MKIAIIGGIGSGKSEVLDVANSLRLHTLSADYINAELLGSPDYFYGIKDAFPNAVEGATINKRILANIIFSDTEARLKLNKIAHPMILQRIREDKTDPIVVEMPLIIESGAKDMFDEVILVHTPMLKRLKRLKARGLSVKDSIKRIKAQVSERELRKIATAVIDNSGDMDSLRRQAKAVFEMILTK